MALNWGNAPLNPVIPFPFDSFDGGTGASITLTGLALGDIRIYKGISMTIRASTAGVVLMDTDGVDIDTTTGLHGFSIDTSDNTDAGFYAAGSFYTVVVGPVTIDAQTVVLVAAESVAGVPEVDLTHVNGAAQTATLDTIKAETVLIVADTNELQVDDTPGALAALDTLIDSIIAAVIINAAGTDVAADIIALKTVADTIATDTTTDLPATLAAIQARLKGLVIHEGTIGSTGNDLTHLHLDGLTYGNDEINGYLLVVFDVSESEYHHREITDWVLATELATVATLPFTPENAVDTYWLLGTLGAASLSGGDATEAKQDAIIALLPTALHVAGAGRVGKGGEELL